MRKGKRHADIATGKNVFLIRSHVQHHFDSFFLVVLNASQVEIKSINIRGTANGNHEFLSLKMLEAFTGAFSDNNFFTLWSLLDFFDFSTSMNLNPFRFENLFKVIRKFFVLTR